MRNLEFILDEDMFLDFQIHHFRHSDEGRERVRGVRIGLVVFYILAAIFCFLYFQGWFRFLTAGLMVPLMIWSVLSAGKIVEKRLVRSVEDFLDQDAGKGSLLGKKTLRWGESEWVLESKNKSWTYPYSGLFKLDRTSDAFYIYTDPLNAVIVPKTAFQNDEEMEACLSWLEEKMKSGAAS